jgi:hypothetical protein
MSSKKPSLYLTRHFPLPSPSDFAGLILAQYSFRHWDTSTPTADVVGVRDSCGELRRPFSALCRSEYKQLMKRKKVLVVVVK